MKSNPQSYLFTVGIPAYNAELYLKDCLESLNRQTFSDFEIIIVNDGSTDKTASICDRFAQSNPNISVIHKKNQGVLTARNNIVESAHGQYIVFLDADDYLHQDALYECFQIIQAAKNPDIIVFNYSITDDFSSPNSISSLTPGLYDNNKFKIAKKALCLGELNSVCAKAIKTNLLKANIKNLPKLIYSEDLYLMTLLFRNAESLYYLQSPLYFYRQNDASNTKKYNPQYLMDLEITLETLLKYGTSWNLSQYSQKGAQLQLCYLASILISDKNIDSTEKKLQLLNIGEAAKRLNISDNLTSLRIDLRTIINSITKGTGTIATLILAIHLKLRKLLHRL